MPVDSAGTAITLGASVTLTGRVTALPPDKTLTGVTAANPGVFTISGGHSFKNGQMVQIKGTVGMINLEGVRGRIAGATATTFRLVESTQRTGTITGITKANPAVVTTSAAHGLVAGDLVRITGVTVMTEVTDGVYMVGTVAGGGTTFVLKTSAGVAIDASGYGSAGTGGMVSSQGTAAAAKTITAITSASPGVVTSASHGFSNGDYVLLDGVLGMSEVNNQIYKVASVATNSFALNTAADAAVDTSGFGAYSSGGTARKLMSTASFATYSSGGVVAPYEGSRIDDNVEVEVASVGGPIKMTVRGANLTV